MSNVKVLFFGADPLSAGGGQAPLELGEEARKIEQEVFAALHRDRVDFKTCWATRIDDLRQSLNRVRPHVVHFSAHGGARGLVLVASHGHGPHRVDAAALKRFFEAFSDQIRVVVLNACHSRPQAEAIAEAVGCAIGTPARIKDAAAIAFSAAFYSSIAYGKSVQTAFDQACATLNMEDFDEGEWPVLVARKNVDPSRLVLVSPVKTRRPKARFAGAATLATAFGVWALWPTPLSPACETARGVLAGVREASEVAAPLGLMRGASATSGPAAGVMNDAKDLYAQGNYAAAFPLFKQAAIAQNPEAEGYVGLAYLRGQGVAPNPDSASHWLALAKKSRDPRGMNGVGEAYQIGFGPDQSDRYAMHWYQEAADQEFPEAMRNLGNMYRDGRSVEANGQTALDWYVKAARAGFVDAMVDAGAMYEHGLGVPVDLEAARCWYDAAARANSPAGMVQAGQMHEARGDYRQARRWYEKAALARNADAFNNLGRLYQNGWSVAPDLIKARQLYQRAADLGSEVGRGNLVRLGAA